MSTDISLAKWFYERMACPVCMRGVIPKLHSDQHTTCQFCNNTKWDIHAINRLMPLARDESAENDTGHHWWTRMGARIQRRYDWEVLYGLLDIVARIPRSQWHSTDCACRKSDTILGVCDCFVYSSLSSFFGLPSGGVVEVELSQ